MTACRWVSSTEPRVIKGRHLDECECPYETPERGCQPCPELHCGTCRREHCDDANPLTCPSCVGDVRDDLEQIVDMHARLRGEAITRGLSGDRTGTVLGGDAMVMLAMTYREQTGVAADGDHSHESEADPVPPLLTLATWEDCWRDHLGHDQADTASVPDAAGYLALMLTRMAQDADLPFDDFTRDIRQVRGRLEDVLHDGVRDETGAPCPACRELDEKAKPLVLLHNDRDASGATDRWQCVRDREHWWTEAGYRLRIGDVYRANADRLTAPDIAAEYDVPAGSVRGWASQGKVRKRGKDTSGRQLYDVADVLAASEKKSA